MDLDEAADELYGQPPTEFTARRGVLVARARAAGDRALAQSIGGLRRPSVSAWLTNQLAREAPGELQALLELGGELRHAQERLAGDELRRLAQRGRDAVDGLVEQAAALAERSGQRASPSALAEVESTLQAALADRGLADEVRTGRLTTALAHSGFGPLPDTPARAPTPSAARSASRAEVALGQARERFEQRQVEHQRARERHQAAELKVRSLESELRARRAELAAAQRALRDAERRLERARPGRSRA